MSREAVFTTTTLHKMPQTQQLGKPHTELKTISETFMWKTETWITIQMTSRKTISTLSSLQPAPCWTDSVYFQATVARGGLALVILNRLCPTLVDPVISLQPLMHILPWSSHASWSSVLQSKWRSAWQLAFCQSVTSACRSQLTLTNMLESGLMELSKCNNFAFDYRANCEGMSQYV